MKLTTREKILITILLAVLFVWLGGCQKLTPATGKRVSHSYLEKSFDEFNEVYFQNKLSKPSIDMKESNPDYLASTDCNESATSCVIHFSAQHITSQRVAALIMLHEQCHMKTWMADMDSDGEQIQHGKMWRSCMLQLDAAGAFRDILID